MYYRLEHKAFGTNRSRLIDVRSPQAAVGELVSQARECGSATLWEDGKRILNGYVRGNKCILNWIV